MKKIAEIIKEILFYKSYNWRYIRLEKHQFETSRKFIPIYDLSTHYGFEKCSSTPLGGKWVIGEFISHPEMAEFSLCFN